MGRAAAFRDTRCAAPPVSLSSARSLPQEAKRAEEAIKQPAAPTEATGDTQKQPVAAVAAVASPAPVAEAAPASAAVRLNIKSNISGE